MLVACGRQEAERWPEADELARGTEKPAAQRDAPSEAQQAQEMRRRLRDATQPAAPWSPELSIAAGESVDTILQQAEAALDQGRILRGENSALGLYLSVLEDEPDNALAKQGLERIAVALQARATAALAEQDYEAAALYVQALQRLRPAQPEVEALAAQLKSQRELSLLLAEAERLFAAGQHTEPSGENAAAIYREVLREQPDNGAAQAGLSRIESALIARASAAAEAGGYAESDRLLAEAGRLRPGSQSVQNASTRIVELRQDRARQLLAQANAAVDAADLDRAQTLLKELETVSAQAQGLDDLRDRIENARIYGGRRPGSVFSEPLAAGGESPSMVVIPIGSFRMGSPSGEDERKPNEGPQRSVNFARGFALSRFEVSVAEFTRFVEASSYVPSSQKARRSTIYDERSGSLAERRGVTWRDDYAGSRAADNLPVVHVSFLDAEAYVAWLSAQTGARYRLPSEAEFEYVLRAGSQSRFPWGDGSPTRLVGNLTGDGDRSPSRRTWSNAFKGYSDGFWGPAPVGSFEPNAFGIHDISGNVSEWTLDCWHDSYARGPVDGSAWVNPGCARRVIRGGSWASAPDQVRSAFRLTASPTATNARVGIRLARDL